MKEGFPRSEIDTVCDMRWYALSARDCCKAVKSILLAYGSRALPDLPKSFEGCFDRSWVDRRQLRRWFKHGDLFSAGELLRKGLVVDAPGATARAIPGEPVYDTERLDSKAGGELFFFKGRKA